MSPRSFYKLLAFSSLSLIAAVAVWMATPDYSAGTFFGEPLLPDLMEKINDVEVVSIEHGGQTLTFLRNTDGNWTLMEENGYPADKERIRNMLLGLSHLEKIEPKTALPEFYPDLHVEDNASENAKSYLVTLLNTDGEQLTSLLVGKNISGITWNGQGYFVRFPNDAQSWLVRGNIDVTGDKRSWMPTRILPLIKGRTASVAIVDGTKTRESVYRRKDPALPLQPSFLSDPYFLTSEEFITTMEKTLTSFDFEGAIKRPAGLEKDIMFTSIMIETVDGLKIYMFLYLMDAKPFAAVSFAAADNAPDTVQKEAVELENIHGKWLYQLSPEKVSGLLPFLSIPEEKVKTEKTEKPKKAKADTKKKPSVKKTASAQKKEKAGQFKESAKPASK